MSHSKRRLLVLVHPGSTCGSADFNLGVAEGRKIRAGLVCELDAWDGDVCVIDGSLSEELKFRKYSALNFAISRLLDRNLAAGHRAERRFGCATEVFDHRDVAHELIDERELGPDVTEVTLTGAWYDPLDRAGAGCINDVRKVFMEAGFAVAIGPAAAQVAPDYDPEEDLEAIANMFM